MMDKKPTDAELEIMHLLWKKGSLTVRQINDLLNKQRQVGYTTTLKTMQIMTEKGFLTRDTDHRSHVYTPTLAPEEVQASVLDHMLKTVFDGSRSGLVMQALGNQPVSEEELERIKALIDQLEAKK
jgi:predicted transcriptional regulator